MGYTSAPFRLTDTDRATLAMTDEDFICDTWEDLKKAIGISVLFAPLSASILGLRTNWIYIELGDLSTLPRKPSILRGYISFVHATKLKYGSIANFLVQRRLRWTTSADGQVVAKNPAPFADRSDWTILLNDWPYGLTSDISHLVVWLKTRLAVNPEDGSMTPGSRALVKDFVDRTFVQRLKEEGAAGDNVLHFKNVTKLQSVEVLEHVHVLVRGVRKQLLDEWTDGDVPMYLAVGS